MTKSQKMRLTEKWRRLAFRLRAEMTSVEARELRVNSYIKEAHDMLFRAIREVEED